MRDRALIGLDDLRKTSSVLALETLLQGGSFFEAPRWRDGRWWVSDFYRHRVVAVDPAGREEEILRVEGRPSGLGWLPDGSLLVVSQLNRRVLCRSPDGRVTVHAEVAELCAGNLNDMVVDAQGRAYVGEFGFDTVGGADPETAVLIRIDPDGSAAVVAADLYFPNGSVVTPDGRTLIVGETMGCRYTAFSIEADGSLSDPRVWAQLAPTPELTTFSGTVAAMRVGPDGCTLDAEGHLWSADLIGARCVRLSPGGEIVAEIPMPAGLNAFACMLGGGDGRTLLICAAPDFDAAARAAAHQAVLLTTTVAVPHAGLP